MAALGLQVPELPKLHISPLDVFWFLLHNPPITLFAAFAVAYLVPRLTRALLRFLVVPAAVVLLGALVIENPQTAGGAATAVFSFVTQHPTEVSAVILLGLALILSPYLLAGVVVLLLVFGVPRLPALLRPALPTPVVEAQARLSDARDAVAGPLAAAGERVRRLVAPAADPKPNPPAPSLADAPRALPSPGDGGGSWLGGALRPLRDLVGLGAPAAGPAAPSLADVPLRAGAPGAGKESWLGGALRPLRDMVGLGALAQDALERK